MLVECGFVRAVTKDGDEYTFTPSLARIAAMGSPHEIVATYAALHGPRAAQEAAYVLACLCDQEDATPLIGGMDICKEAPSTRTRNWWAFWARYANEPQTPARAKDVEISGAMPEAEQIIIAQHLMQHGICGKARPGAGGGRYSDRFDAAEYIAAATVDLGLSDADAGGLSMTDFQLRFEIKFPDAKKAKEQDLPTRDEYEAVMARLKGAKRGA